MKIGFIDWPRFHGRDVKTVGSTQLRVDNVIAVDKDFGHWTQGSKWDAYIFQKVYWYEMMESLKEPKILDLCDPDWLKLEEEGGVSLVKASKLVDAITCSSEGLTKYVSNIIKDIPVVHVPDRVNFDLFPEPKIHTGSAKIVVWFGYWHNAKEVLDVYEVLNPIREAGYKLLIVSNQDFVPTCMREGNGLEVKTLRYDSDTAYYEIQKGDIFINPSSVTNANFKYKSNNKTVIAWKLGLPLARGGDDLIKFRDASEREKEKKRNLEIVEKEYNVQKSAEQYKEIINNILHDKKR